MPASRRKKIVLGITGSVAAPKAVELLRLLTEAGHDVRVVMTAAARRFVGEEEFEALSGHPVAWEQFPADFGEEPDFTHIDLSQSDLMVIAPATANTLGKMAAGIADNLLLSTYLAFAGKVVFCPAMNQRMWMNPAVQENVRKLIGYGALMVPPEQGRLACGEEGIGRMAEPETIMSTLAEITDEYPGKDLADLKILVTAGGTREPIDAVRYITNRSSGKMGLSIAEAAYQRGAQVTLVTANCDIMSSVGVRRIDVETSDELRKVLEVEFMDCDILVMAAAVSDYKVSSSGTMGKIGRNEKNSLHLISTADIVSSLDGGNDGSKLKIGFAAEYGGNSIDRARRKLTEKKLDMIIFNDISRDDIGFESDYNEITIITPDGEDINIDRTTKALCAHAIWDHVASRTI